MMNNYHTNRGKDFVAMSFRNDRFYCVNNEWFFSIRRGPDQGPYSSKEEAQLALKSFIADQRCKQRERQAEQELLASYRSISPRII